MIGTVIVPLDGSELSERALNIGQAIAGRTSSDLLLARIGRIGADEPEMEQIRKYLKARASNVSGKLATFTDRGRPAQSIIELAHQHVDPIIVMSTHGRGGIHRWMAGSVAEEVVRGAGVPVLLVRGDQEIQSAEKIELRSILLPVDGSRYSESAIDYAVELARLFGSTLHLIRVVDTPSAYGLLSRHMETAATGDILDEIIDSMRNEANAYIDQLAERLSNEGVQVRKTVVEGFPGEQLIEHERRGFFQLVVMATAGRSGVSRVVFGSVAERMLKLGRSPVMMVRPPDEIH
ncbi:MAG: universal stress protein [Sphaerobacteraceae bacterium]|nr:MAG: universal stress protein [Sphaerobacteraceae bacterium]